MRLKDCDQLAVAGECDLAVEDDCITLYRPGQSESYRPIVVVSTPPTAPPPSLTVPECCTEVLQCILFKAR